ncbi:MAG: hypothetical protein NTW20_11790 [Rhodobacterales bacterium]|nr:hypothetical protein [Rhodobacterales bacterium]
MTIKVLTNVRADAVFLDLWIRYYGAIFGRENLHIMLDGDDWEPQSDLTGTNVHVVKDLPRDRARLDNQTAAWQSRAANWFLKRGARAVLRTDIDEFVALDPAVGGDLPGYLAALGPEDRVAAFGVDVVQGPQETALDQTRPILAQRRNAVITHEFTKLVAVRQALRWRSGFHRGQHVPVDVRQGLILFHLAMFDEDIARQRIRDRGLIAGDPSQSTHITGRLARFDEIRQTSPLAYDDVAGSAWTQMMQSVASPTGPHVGRIADGNLPRGYHVLLPDRFAGLLPAARSAG